MGLKEKIKNNSTGKPLMGTFFATQMLDLAMTNGAMLFFNAKEVNPLAAEIIDNNGLEDAMIIKIALTTLLIGTYALSSIRDSEIKLMSQNIRLKHSTEKALQAGTVFMSGVLAWNTVNIGVDIASKIKI